MAADSESDGSTDDDDPSSVPPGASPWWRQALLFTATVVTVFMAGVRYARPEIHGSFLSTLPAVLLDLPSGAAFAVPLLAILITHELGHYVAARVHRVDASLPYFIPLPYSVSMLGTMGAVIGMRGRIRSRDALLDIGASGPLAGMCVAIPVLVAGLMESKVGPVTGSGWEEGQCLLYMALKRLICGPIPPGSDVFLTPMAFAGWAGLLLTMLNLLPVGQLDGGHIAYALFGVRQNRYARVLHALLLVMFIVNVVRFVGPVMVHRAWDQGEQAVGNSVFWLVWYALLHVIQRLGGGDHAPTEPGELSPVRKGLAVLSLVLFVLLFMPTPMSTY